MALKEFGTDLQFISRNAAKLASKLGEFEGNTEMLRDMVASRIAGEGLDILLEELKQAIALSGEYNDPIFREDLERAFNNPALINITRGGASIMPQAMSLVGQWSELSYGVDAARAVLGLGRLSQEQANEFWKQRIYRPARENLKVPQKFKKNIGFYKTAKKGQKIPFDYQRYAMERYGMTIETRKSFWGNKAPYWLWLNFGNVGAGAYPEVKPTHFVAHAERKINVLLEQRIFDITREFTNAITREVEAFLRNPQSYQAGQEIDRFMLEGAEFRLGVTPGGQLGIRRIG